MKLGRRQFLQALFAAPITTLLFGWPSARPPTCIPFARLPLSTYIRGPRYRVMFDRIVTPVFKQPDKIWRKLEKQLRSIRTV